MDPLCSLYSLLIGIFSLNVDESVSGNFGRLWSLWFQGPKKARLEHSRPLLSIKGLNIVVHTLLLLTSVEALLNFFCIVSLEFLMVTNDLRNWTLFTNCYPRTNWTPDKTAGFKIDWYPPHLKTCGLFAGEIPRFIRQASFMCKSAQVISMFRPSERTVLSSFKCHFLHLYQKKFKIFSKITMSLFLP